MGKRKPGVIRLSSDSSEDEEVQTHSADHSRFSKSRSKPLSSLQKKARGGRSKHGGYTGSYSLHFGEAEAKFATLSEEFCDCLHDFDLTRGYQRPKYKELWIDKYQPNTIAELAVHKKKAEEVKSWLEERLATSKGGVGNVLLLTGQAGVGKSVVVRVIASHLGAQLVEWTTPTPTLWQEHVHNVNLGLRYMSKLDEFQDFVEKIEKYSLLHCSTGGTSRKPDIILIDDLPVANGIAAFGRLKKCLASLTHSARIPIIILITEYHKVELGENSAYHCEELVSFLEGVGAHKVVLNPLTVNSIKKVLFMLCQEEKCDVTSEQIDQIAKASCGDIRNAITSLQYYCLRSDNLHISPELNWMETKAELVSGRSSLSPVMELLGKGELSCSAFFSCGRDQTLSLFHALGKFLHNKRVEMDAFYMDSESLNLKEKYLRKPLKMDAPEKVLSQAYGQARPVTDFLHENVLDFVSDGAIDDACVVTSYLSDADYLLGSTLHLYYPLAFSKMYDSQGLSHSVASSVAVRGVLFGNSQPLSSRWHTIRSPRLWQIEHSAKQYMNQLLNEKFCSVSYFGLPTSQILTEYQPASSWIKAHCAANSDGNKKVVAKPSVRETLFVSHNYSEYLEYESFGEKSEEDEIEGW